MVAFIAVAGGFSMSRPRILIAEFKHETNTFCSTQTTLKDFKNRYLKIGQEIVPFFRESKVEMGGFITACNQFIIEIVPAVAGNATPGGVVSREAYHFFEESVLDNLMRQKRKIDGLLISLHGAMVTEDYLDGDGAFLSSIRRAIGYPIPIVATLDLHANLSQDMVSNVDVFFPYESYPHLDQYCRGYEAGKCIVAILNGHVSPITKMKPLPILIPSLETSKNPMKYFVERAHKLKENPKIINVSVLHGFSWADTPFTGMSVMATTDGDPELANSIIETLSEEILSRKSEFLKQYYSIEEAILEAINTPEGPIILADVSDNPGGGGTGDGTHILSKLIEMKVKDVGFGIIVDPEVVHQAIQAGVGNVIQVQLGGKTEKESLFGKPVEVTAKVRTIADGIFVNKGLMAKGLENDMGIAVVLDIDGIEVIVPEKRIQPWDPEIFLRMGIDPTEKKILVLKSALHFRASFAEMAKKIIEVDARGLLSSNFTRLNYSKLTRPKFPIDKNF